MGDEKVLGHANMSKELSKKGGALQL